MQIMYMVSSLEKCGPINVLYNIAKEVNKKHKCLIVTLSPENNKSMSKEFSDLDIEIVHLNLDRNEKKQNYINKLKKLIQKYQPDIIHTHGYRSDRYINMINGEYVFKHVTTLHNFPFSDYPNLYGFISGTLLAFLHMYTISRIDYKIACSYSITNKYKRYFISGISTIQNGVDVNIYKAISNYEKYELRGKLGLPLDKKIVISTGAIIKRKRPKKLLEVFSKYSSEDEVLFLILGDGKLFGEMRKYSRSNIKLLGSVKNVVDYLQASDVFISNSKAEGLPMAMLEAASTGLMIVGSDILPHREVKEIYNKRTILYQGQSTQVITECISKSICKSNNWIEGNEEPFKLSSYNMANKYLDYYKSMKVT